ncbi:efflux RND transporter periplasmic adaptor subunit [Aureimonas populi]|uniref:Efflux RND transporter periplasmic adaptor subunit n=1 Tax=Aureimonas populi TaxID=1701758 RepID=A0ABW5CNN5_9HYPH|nr:efflux RND transporter periplasmic adaptor subunit [Aureimonas populi]
MAAAFVALIPGGAHAAGADTASLAQAVSVVTAQGGAVAETARLTGSVVARELVLVGSDLTDLRIVSIEAEAGDTVRAGDVLARLDDTMLLVERDGTSARLAHADAAIAQARNQIEDATIALAQAQADRERSGRLQERGVVPAETLEARTTAMRRAGTALSAAHQALTSAEAERKVVEADLARIEAQLEFTKIRASQSGLILQRNASVGAVAASGGEALFTIAQDGIFEFDAEVSEQSFARMRVGQKVRVTVAGQDGPLDGTVRLRLPILQGGSRLGRLRVTLPEGIDLPVGAFARGDVEVAMRSGVFLPASAVQIHTDEVFVQTVRDGVVARRPVEVGLRAAGLVEVRSGVEAGETVVLKAGSFLGEGDRIAPVLAAYAIPEVSLESALLTLAADR